MERHRYAVLGAGLMGRVIARDLLEAERDARVDLCDRDAGLLREATAFVGSERLRPVRLDATDRPAAARALTGHAAAVNALPHRFSLHGLEAAIAAGVPIVDLVGAAPERRLELDTRARAAGILVVPGCGVAPGLSNVLVARGVELLDRTDEAVIYVGGIPKTKTPPLAYQTVYSLTSVLGAYTRPARIVVDGTPTSVESLSGLERLEFPQPIGPLEAFYTDGLASLRLTMQGVVTRSMAEKTLRYPGHAERIRCLKACGLLDTAPIRVGDVSVAPIDLLIARLTPLLRLGPGGDILVMRVRVSGMKRGATRIHTFDLIDRFDPDTRCTAMARTTGFPAAHAARVLADGTIRDTGVRFPEQIFVAAAGRDLLGALEARGVTITHRETGA